MVKVDGQSLNNLLVQNGYAWVYPQYCTEKLCADFFNSESVAKHQKKGLWKDSVVVPPREWRAAQRGDNQDRPQPETTPPLIMIGEKQNVGPSESLLSKLRNSLRSNTQSDSDSSPNKAGYRCDGRVFCSQMTSCQEAKFFLRNCPGTKMDGNNDGVPCERQWCH